MAIFVIKNPIVTVDAVDLSDHCTKATVTAKFDKVDATAFGSNFKQSLQGLGDATIELEFNQDYAAASVNATLWPLVLSGDQVEIVVTPRDVAVSATNPEFHMTGALYEYTPIDGTPGTLAKTPATFENGGVGGMTMVTS